MTLTHTHAAEGVHDFIRNRRSPVALATTAIPDADLRALLEAARWAASAMNRQPWRFVLARKGEDAYDRLFDTLMEGNRRWAGAAPVLLLVTGEAVTPEGRDNPYAAHDVGLATGNLFAEATARGIYGHIMAAFDKDAAREAFGIPADYQPLTVIALGYVGDAAALPEDLQAREARPRQRRPLTEIVFADSWGSPSPLAE